jgi:FSR family fosmidomycin resistance protein-like MFS transporter
MPRRTRNPGDEDLAEKRSSVAQVALLSSAHLVHDGYMSFLSILLPLLITKFGLTLFLAGLLAPMGQLASVGQPVFGYLADRWGARRFVVLTVATTGSFAGLIGVAPSYFVLAMLLFALGLSSALYHPAGSALLTRAVSRRWGSALAIYHLGGNLGLAAGPIAVTFVVTRFGLESTYFLVLPALLWALLLWRFVPQAAARVTQVVNESFFQVVAAERRSFSLLGVVILARAVGTGGFTLFLPTYLIQGGSDFVRAGIVTALFFAMGGLGGLVSGALSDRFGRRAVLATMMLLAVPAVLTFLTSVGPLSTVALLLAASLLLGEQPVFVALAQEQAPEHRGTAVGFVFGAQFVLAGLAAAAVGALADLYGLGNVFLALAPVPLIGIPALLMLRESAGAPDTAG